MKLSDESFREAFKPLQIPAHYDINGSEEDRVLFALAQIGEGTVSMVAAEMATLEPGAKPEAFFSLVKHILTDLYEKGLLKGSDIRAAMHYNLSKITVPNEGVVDPDLLAPGLD